MTSSLTIREAQSSDRPAITTVLRDAFGQDDEAKLVEALWRQDAMALEFVAVKNKEVTGYCAFSLVTSEPALKGPALGMAPVAVAPKSQNKGVGMALVETGVSIVKERGASLLVVLGEPDYYSRFGFTPASRHNVSWAVMDAGDAFQMIDFANIDCSQKRTVNYHPAFSAV